MYMMQRLARYLWGDLTQDELKKFVYLALGFFFLIGSFWPLKTLKDSIFINTVGAAYLPLAKMFSLLCFFPVVMGYSYLVDIISKERLIYGFTCCAAAVGFLFSYFFMHPTIGLVNTTIDAGRMLGWFFYCFIECYISLMLSTYWSFVNDITPPESAKKGYGLMIFGTQLGGFVFITFANLLSRNPDMYAFRAPIISAVCFALFFGVAAVVYLLTHSVNKKALEGYHAVEQVALDKKVEKTERIRFMEGLYILITQPYVMGIFMIVWLQEILGTIITYQMYVQLERFYQSPGLRNAFLFDFSFSIQLIACLFGLLGTSFFQRRFGIRSCLVGYPLLLAGLIIVYFFYQSLWSIAFVLMVAKALNYAFNQPTKEILYIPTSHDVKYKSKAWIDMFGLRFGKMVGAFFNTFALTHEGLIAGFVLGILTAWMLVAQKIGSMFQKITNE
jgi:AAA family ATP:ADP antiporter